MSSWHKRSHSHKPHFTGMAQGQRAGLITLRSQDRNLLPVLFINSHKCIKALRAISKTNKTHTGVAQRQSV